MRAETRLVAFVCAAEILGLAGFSLVPALLPQFIATLSLSNAEAGWLAAIMSGGYMDRRAAAGRLNRPRSGAHDLSHLQRTECGVLLRHCSERWPADGAGLAGSRLLSQSGSRLLSQPGSVDCNPSDAGRPSDYTARSRQCADRVGALLPRTGYRGDNARAPLLIWLQGGPGAAERQPPA